jgi:predicted TIM-barrel enzyme
VQIEGFTTAGSGVNESFGMSPVYRYSEGLVCAGTVRENGSRQGSVMRIDVYKFVEVTVE